MAMNALLFGVKNSLYSGLGLTAANCRIMPDERPIPKCGREFFSIYGSAWQPFRETGSKSIHEEYQVTVAITLRTTQIPFDRQGEKSYVHENMTDAERLGFAIDQRAVQVMNALHNNHVVMETANDVLNTYYNPGDDPELPDPGTLYPFLTTLKWEMTTPSPIIVGPSHFSSEDSNPEEAGFLLNVVFGGCYRSRILTTTS